MFHRRFQTGLALLASCMLAGCRPPEPMEEVVPNQKIVYLVKANDDVISHCKCERTLIGAPAQMDCPWCGCGWLFLCPKCRKAFTFARAEEVDLTWEQLAHNDLDGKWGRNPSLQEVEQWIGFMKILLKDIEAGKQYAYIDGWVFSTERQDLRFEGWHARHELALVPQAAAVKDRALLDQTLGSEEYWHARAIQEP